MGVYANAHYQSRLRAMADRLGFFVIDPLPALAKSSPSTDALFIPYDRNHPSAAGHRIVAQTIVDYLDRHEELGRMSLEWQGAYRRDERAKPARSAHRFLARALPVRHGFVASADAPVIPTMAGFWGDPAVQFR